MGGIILGKDIPGQEEPIYQPATLKWSIRRGDLKGEEIFSGDLKILVRIFTSLHDYCQTVG